MTDIDLFLGFFINSRLAPEEQRRNLLEAGLDAQRVEAAYNEFRRQAIGRRWMYPPPMLVDSGAAADSWYLGADSIADARFWPSLKKYLLEDKQWPEPAVDSIHAASDKIVAWLQSPTAAQIKTRGLVVGYVQSGKTANFTAVISKAADAGYRFFIVLSGTKNALRSQTQRRLNRELIDLNLQYWFSPTSIDRDFLVNADMINTNYFLSERREGKVLCVVKKNVTILRRLARWLQSANREVLSSCPFLIIDDEADEASINTAPRQSNIDPEDIDRTAINRQLVRLLGVLPKAAYVGYTATPFANVLIDPLYENDLYPRDFIVSLPKPDGHFGTEDIFGRERLLQDETDEEFQGLDVVRIVPDDEVASLKPPSRNVQNFNFTVTPSLKRALQYFWLATAARRVRGQSAAHSTMLVHTSEKISVHNLIRDRLEVYRRDYLQRLRSTQRDTMFQEMADLWSEEAGRVRMTDTEGALPLVTFAELEPYLLSVIQTSAIVVDNSQSSYRLNYDGEGKIQIAVGGNTLARGLTLEGLIVSFFVRSASAYDTLLQMGRWFGYRAGYSDLPRIWMTNELDGYFYDLATVEAELRQDIERYAVERVTPREFGVRIRAHPDLNITARMKMQYAVTASVSFAARKHQTVLFNHRNVDWLQGNIRAAADLVNKMTAEVGDPVADSGHQVFRGVPVRLILEFINSYRFHEASSPLNSRLLTGYIQKQNTVDSVKMWNVVIRGVKGAGRSARGTIGLGPLRVPLLERSRRPDPIEYANIGVLMTKGDIGADLGLASTASMTEDSIISLREQQMPRTGLLIIYPINKDSRPEDSSRSSGQERRAPLGAAEHLIGLGIVFPPAVPGSDITQDYVTVDPTRLYGEDVEDVEIDTGDE